MCIPERGGVHLTRRPRPVEGESEWQPTSLRPEFFLTHVVRPATAFLPDASAHHQKIDDATVGHVHVVPVIDAGAEDHHGLALGLLGIARKRARHGNHGIGFDAGDALLPGGRVGNVVGIGARNVAATKATVDTVVGAEKIEDGCHIGVAIGQRHGAHRHVAHQNVFVVGASEVVMMTAAEVGEGHRQNAFSIW